MTDRSRILTLAGVLVFLFAAVLLLRQAVRSLAEPFATLERFALAPRPPAPEPEEDFKELVRAIDWDEPPAPAPAAPRKPKATPAKRVSLTVEKVLLSEYRGAVEAHWVTVRDVARVQVARFHGAPDLEGLATSLSLSASQKERISALMTWRAKSLEALTAADRADAGRVKSIEDRYEAAVALELDNVQREKYQEMKSGSTALQLSAYILKTKEAAETTAAGEWLKSVGKEK